MQPHDYIIHLIGGWTYFTGGFESIDSLTRCIAKGCIDACADYHAKTYHPVVIAPSAIAAIEDIR